MKNEMESYIDTYLFWLRYVMFLEAHWAAALPRVRTVISLLTSLWTFSTFYMVPCASAYLYFPPSSASGC